MTLTCAEYLLRHEAALRQALESLDCPALRLKEAMAYMLFPGGKRMRPLLMYLCGDLLDIPLLCLDPMAVAVELTHAYSLIHDDLPAMDNDDFRRGKPSCHRAFDEATAILAGDALQAFALEFLMQTLSQACSPLQTLHATQALLAASGASGMVSGQCLDLQALQATSLNETQLTTIHTLKTGQLISACVEMLIQVSSASTETHYALREFAQLLGLVFQIQDDYLDYYAPDTLGKNRYSDKHNNKITFASLFPKEALLDRITNLYTSCFSTLAPFGSKAEALRTFLYSMKNSVFCFSPSTSP